jgi:hypothetical protein
MMPFANPIGGYYATIYEPAIKKAGLTPVRADTDIFATGKIIDQIWCWADNDELARMLKYPGTSAALGTQPGVVPMSSTGAGQDFARMRFATRRFWIEQKRRYLELYLGDICNVGADLLVISAQFPL